MFRFIVSVLFTGMFEEYKLVRKITSQMLDALFIKALLFTDYSGCVLLSFSTGVLVD